MSRRPGEPRVLVTGLGLVTALGSDTDQVWADLVAGAHGVGPIRSFDARAMSIDFAAEVATNTLGDDDPRVLTRTETFALAAARRALAHGGLANGPGDGEHWGVCLAAGSVPDWTAAVPALAPPCAADPASAPGATSDDRTFVDPNTIDARSLFERSPALRAQHEPGRAARAVARTWGLGGPVATMQAASCSGTQAVGEALRWLRRGRATAVLVGGASAISRFALAALEGLGVLAPSEGWSHGGFPARPFDRHRRGFVLGEGAAMLLLETEGHARVRDARILAELAGYGSSCDGHRFTAMEPAAEGASEALGRALEDAGVAPTAIDHVNLHGTATLQNDAMESRALDLVLGARARTVPMSANKPQVGHTLCASGALEAAFTTLAVATGMVPPVLGRSAPDPACPLHLLDGVGGPAAIEVALSQSFGFGGQNGALVFRKYRPTPQGTGRAPSVRRSPSVPRGPALVVTGLGRAEEPLAADSGPTLPRRLRRMTGPCGRQALLAAQRALEQGGLLGTDSGESAGIETVAARCHRAGVFLGVVGFDLGPAAFLPAVITSLDRQGRFDAERFATIGSARLDPFLAVRALPNTTLCALTMVFGLHGPSANFIDADDSGLHAMAAALCALAAGEIELALVGATDDPDQPHRRPSQQESGPRPIALSQGAGAAMLVIETAEHARRRGARALAEIELDGGRSSTVPRAAGRTLRGATGPILDLLAEIETRSRIKVPWP